jgi:L-rhamnose mutarotase
LFAYYEYTGEDYASDMAAIAADPDTQRWWTLTDPCQLPLDSAAEGERWVEAGEVFHLD